MKNKLKKVLLLIVFIALMIFATQARSTEIPNMKTYGTPVNVIILYGNSLVGGSGKSSEIPFMSVPSWINFYNTGSDKYDEGSYGIEQGLFQSLDSNSKWVIIKHAIGGSRIERWLPGSYIWDEAIDLTKAILSNYENYNIIGVFMAVAEADSDDENYANWHYDNMENFIESFRDILEIQVPFVIQLATTFQGEYIDIVRDAQRRLAEDLNKVHTINFDHLEKREDEIHNTTESTIEVGLTIGIKVNKRAAQIY